MSDLGKSGWAIAVSNCDDGLVAVVEEEDEARSSGMAKRFPCLETIKVLKEGVGSFEYFICVDLA